MPRAAFAHVETWVFDLDNTLYPPAIRLFDQIERRMTDYVMRALGVPAAEADALRARYWRSYGTTLAGLMREHGIDPAPYLEHVHDIDLTAVVPAPQLCATLGRLRGRKVVYTNGSREHARRVTKAIGLEGCFDALYGFEDAAYVPKPEAAAFATVFALDGLDAARAAMFEDDHRNLEVPHRLGMRTVLVGPEASHPHVHHRTDDLVAFLGLVA
jgi:putative hydrolase of the HAD superfamily